MSEYPLLVNFDPVALPIGPLNIHWYGLMYLLAFAAFWTLASHRAGLGKAPLNREQVGDFLFFGILGVILGGRIGYMLVYGSQELISDPLSLFKIWQGGMSFHGGLIGVALAALLFARRANCRFFDLTDFIIPMVPLCLMFGRIGNFIGGELWGRVTDVSWGMLFPRSLEGVDIDSAAFMQAYVEGVYNDQARHPSQLYQAGLEGLLLFLLLYWYSRKPRPRMAVSGWFLVGYSIFRGFSEFYREPDEQLGFLAFEWLTMGMLLSVPMFLFGVVLIMLAYKHKVYYQNTPNRA